MRNKKIQFANLVIRSGEKTLLDLFDNVVYPAFTNEIVRNYGSTSYIFHRTRLVNLDESEDGSGLAIIGRIVKDEYLHIEQILEDGELEEADETHRRSPSSIFVIFLKNHRMAYVREHVGAPNIQAFEKTLEYFIKHIHKSILKSEAQKIRSIFPKNEWIIRQKENLDDFPTPTVDIVPLSDARSIKEAILALDSIGLISFEIVRQNDEYNSNTFFDTVRDEKVQIGNPSKAIIKFSDNEGGFNIEKSADLVETAIDDQNVVYNVEGISTGQNVKYTNKCSDDTQDDSAMSISILTENGEPTPYQVASQANKEFTSMATSGKIKEPTMKNQEAIFPRLRKIIHDHIGI